MHFYFFTTTFDFELPTHKTDIFLFHILCSEGFVNHYILFYKSNITGSLTRYIRYHTNGIMYILVVNYILLDSLVVVIIIGDEHHLLLLIRLYVVCCMLYVRVGILITCEGHSMHYEGRLESV